MNSRIHDKKQVMDWDLLQKLQKLKFMFGAQVGHF